MLVVSTVGDGEPKCLKLEQDGGWLVLYDAAGLNSGSAAQVAHALRSRTTATSSCIRPKVRRSGRPTGY